MKYNVLKGVLQLTWTNFESPPPSSGQAGVENLHIFVHVDKSPPPTNIAQPLKYQK